MDALHHTPDEPEHLPDYRNSQWLRLDSRPAYWGDPVTLVLFNEALAFLEAMTNQFHEFGPWTAIPSADLMEALYQHNQRAQAEGRLGEGEEVTLIHVLTLSRRRLMAFEETGWNLTHYDDLARFVDGTITQALAGMMSDNNPTLTYRILLASLPPEDRLEEDDPDYPDYEGDSGCRTCASGQPCWVRIEEDIHDILAEAHLPASEALACLEWMLAEGRSTLTQSITQMGREFASVRVNDTTLPIPSPLRADDANLLENAVSQDKANPARG